jgi:hypothetical protein
MMIKVYILAKSGAEGIQEITSVHMTMKGAQSAWKILCDDLVKEYERHINHELEREVHGNHWVQRWLERIDALKTYDYEYIQEKLYPSEVPYILESEIKK